MRAKIILSALITVLFAGAAGAADIGPDSVNPGGVGYTYQISMGATDTATVTNHVGGWSWEDNSLFKASTGEAPVGWTHTSNWIALQLNADAKVTIHLEPQAGVPWPSATDASRTASTDQMYPAFTIWKNWDNDYAPFPAFKDTIAPNSPSKPGPVQNSHTYNNRGAVAWAEDLVYLDNYFNSTAQTIERSYVLPAGKYTIAVGSNAPTAETPANRQGYKAVLTTAAIPISVAADTYFMSSLQPFTPAVASGVVANDLGFTAGTDTLEVTAQPSHGSVVLNNDGTFTYTPNQYFGLTGYDTFSYRGKKVSTGEYSASAAVTISSLTGAAGTYTGLVKDEESGEIAGIVKVVITPTGKFTSAVQFLGARSSLAGSFAQDGDAVIKGKTKLDLEHLALSVHADGNRHLHLHIHGADGQSHYEAHVAKSPFSVSNPTALVGKHVVTLTAASTLPEAGVTTSPGTGTLTVLADGSATLTGKTGDRTTFSTATALQSAEVTGPTLPVYSTMFTSPGKLAGTLTFGLDATSGATGELKEVRPDKGKAIGYTVNFTAATAPAPAKKK